MSAAALRRIRDDGSWLAPQWPMPLGIGGQFSAAVSDPVGYPRAQLSIPSTATPPKWINAYTRAAELTCQLGHDWDQRGSAEVSIDVLSFAANILANECLNGSAPLHCAFRARRSADALAQSGCRP